MNRRSVRLLMPVEGQSEEAFVKQSLAPWLAERGVFVQNPVLLWTKRLPEGSGFRGGVANWAQAAAVPADGGPEAINHGPHTHPQARLRQAWPGYKETSDGPTLLAKIGIPAVRARCPHFAAWLDQLEALGRAA